ncbi:O-methyltransferase [Haliangium sp.]|uniref:O-methyltransferase n=1 Tax=Haliangium sp. TaxID=2663208 RepID=UPI003D13B520
MADQDSRAGKRYDSAEIRDFVNRLHAPHDAVLGRAFDAPAQHGMPAIMLGPSEARLLELLVRMIGARKAVEIGSLAGYSALRIAAALPPDGRLWTIEFDPGHAEVTRTNLAEAGFGDRAEVLVGRGLDVLPGLVAHGPFDAVFLDADKESYRDYGVWAADNLRPGGLVVADNAYAFGTLLGDTPLATSVRTLHEEVARRFHSVCIPTPDGLLIGLKK